VEDMNAEGDLNVTNNEQYHNYRRKREQMAVSLVKVFSLP